MSDALLNGLGVPQVVFLWPASASSCPQTIQAVKTVRTMKTTRPRSPVGFRWRLAISSRYGTTTVHPWRAMNPCKRVELFGRRGRRIHTKAIHNVASHLASGAEYRSRMPCRCLFRKQSDMRVAAAHTTEGGPGKQSVSVEFHRSQLASAIHLPPWVRRIGLPVRVMATSEMGCLLRRLWATFFWVDRKAVWMEAIFFVV